DTRGCRRSLRQLSRSRAERRAEARPDRIPQVPLEGYDPAATGSRRQRTMPSCTYLIVGGGMTCPLLKSPSVASDVQESPPVAAARGNAELAAITRSAAPRSGPALTPAVQGTGRRRRPRGR